MDRLLALLFRYSLVASADVAAPPDEVDVTALTDEQLGELNTELIALFDEIRAAEQPDLVVLQRAVELVEALGQEDERRQAQAGEDEALVASLEARMGLRSSQPRVPLADLARRRSARHDPLGSDFGGLAVRVVLDNAQPADDLSDVAARMHERARMLSGAPLRGGEKFHVAHFAREYPEERALGTDIERNAQRIEAVVASARQAWFDGDAGATVEALAAAGGLCAPLPASYAQEIVGTDERPIRNALPRFDASRGGVRWMPPPILSTIDLTGSDAGVGVWTMTDDVNAATDAAVRKSIQRIACGVEQELSPYAVYDRFLIGNVLARTFPERVEAMIRQALIAHARLAETRFAMRLKALSVKPAEETQVLGSRRDIVAQVIKAAWAIRNRYRMAETEPLQALFPDALVAHAKIDFARQLPGDGRAPLSRDEFAAELRAAGVMPIFSPDMPSHMAAATQVEGAQLTDLPSPIEWAIWPMGLFSYLDGGRLDLGFSAGTPIRDTTRNAANDLELFAEEWEEIAPFGAVQSVWNRSYVCPTGEVAGTVDVSCDTAS